MLFCVDVCSILVPKVYTFFGATMQNFLFKALKCTAYTFFSESGLRLRNFFLECAPVALVCNYEVWTKDDDF